jgi:chorismate mutase
LALDAERRKETVMTVALLHEAPAETPIMRDEVEELDASLMEVARARANLASAVARLEAVLEAIIERR